MHPPWYGTTKPREEEEEDEEVELEVRWICDHHDEETPHRTMHSQIRNMEGTLVTQEKGPRTGTTDHKTFSVQRLPKLRVQAKLDGVHTNAAYTTLWREHRGGRRSCVKNAVKGSPVCLVTQRTHTLTFRGHCQSSVSLSPLHGNFGA